MSKKKPPPKAEEISPAYLQLNLQTVIAKAQDGKYYLVVWEGRALVTIGPAMRALVPKDLRQQYSPDDMPETELAKAFVTRALVPKQGSLVEKPDLYQQYTEWARRQQGRVLAVTHFGRMVREAIPDIKDGRIMRNGRRLATYVDVEARSIAEIEEIQALLS